MTGWFPFVQPWDKAPAGAFDASFLNAKPAGANGRIVVRNGQFVESKTGRRVRFFATNIGTSAAFPSHEDAEKIADRLAGLGINLVRFHHLNNGWEPNGGTIWKRDRIFLEIDPVQLDRFDYFVAALKKRGIYSNINLQTAREYLPEMGFPESVRQLRDFAKKVDKFDERMIQLQQQYARDLIGRRNPYTGLRYCDDPAILKVEINNENSLVGWPGEEPGTGLGSLPEPFRGNLVRLWNDWLRRKYGGEEAIRRAWPDQDLILGPSVTDRRTRWTHENHSNGDVTFEVYRPEGGQGSMGMKATVRSNPGPNWHVQMHLSGLDLKNGQPYIVEFRARAERPVTVGVDARLDKSDWRFLGLTTSIRLEPQWRTYRLAFRCRRSEPNSARIGWVIGEARGSIWVENVRVLPGVRSEGIPPGQRLGTIDLPPPDLSPRFQDYIRFLAESEKSYSERMRRFLREELGFKETLIIDTQITWGGLTGPWREESMDYTDMHEYWHNPLFLGRDWDPQNYRVERRAMVNEMGKTDGVLGNAARVRLAGKPFSLSEYNHPAPSDYQVEMMPLLTAYASAQDWDAIYSFAWDTTGTGVDNTAYDNYYNLARNPSKAGFFPIAAAIYRMGLFEPAGAVRAVRLPEVPWSRNYHWHEEWEDQAPDALGLNTRLYAEWRAARAPAARPGQGTRLEVRSGEKGQVLAVGNDRAAILVGFVGGTTQRAGVLEARFDRFGEKQEGFAGLMLAAMDGKPIRSSGRVAVALIGRTENAGMGWNEARNSVSDQWGRGPVMAEPIPATLSLPADGPRKVFALNPDGTRRAELQASFSAGRVTFRVGPSVRSLWFEVAPR
ncbi:MAG: carbohydrate binding domain-containing protein [Fimbriimonadales bacterium]|nr:carbohydrate binding domain-containing protein [Fimbriimonadales bacterium]